jgi:hypothetical protein
LIFAPPLIGGTAVQQLRMYRPIIRYGYDLFSFSFSGHGISDGRFSLRASLEDTRHALCHAAEMAVQKKLPLVGIATSYSAIPLLDAARSQPPPFHMLVLINPLTRLRPLAILRSFRSFSKRHRHQPPSGGRVSAPIQAYLDSLFPGIGKGADRFGSLRRQRARVFRILKEVFSQNPLSDAALPDTPTLCLYGRNDDVLRIFHSNLRTDYEAAIRRICPDTRFQALPGGHFFRCPKVRGLLAESILSFISGKELILERRPVRR